MLGSRKEILAVFELLDSTDRLLLFPESESDPAYDSGAVAVGKDLDWDRLISDARPPNSREIAVNFWTQLLGFPSLLVELRLALDEVLAQYSDDISDYYPSFMVSRERALRNVFKINLHPSEVCHLKCFKPWMHNPSCLKASLATLCQGDSWAVEFGQCAHLALGARSRALDDDTLLSLRSRLPRGSYCSGIILDDHVGLEKEPAASPRHGIPQPRNAPPAGAQGPLRFARMRAEYLKNGLKHHPKKTQYRVFDGIHWGVQVEGLEGWASTPLPKLSVLVNITMQVVALGLATVELLESLAGSWVAVCLIYRRSLCSFGLDLRGPTVPR